MAQIIIKLNKGDISTTMLGNNIMVNTSGENNIALVFEPEAIEELIRDYKLLRDTKESEAPKATPAYNKEGISLDMVDAIKEMLANELDGFVGSPNDVTVRDKIKSSTSRVLRRAMSNLADSACKHIILDVVPDVTRENELKILPKNLFTALLLIGIYKPRAIEMDSIVINSSRYTYSEKDGFVQHTLEG